MADISDDIVNTLPKIVELSKYVYPRLFTQICSYQPTPVPLAAAYGVTLTPSDSDSEDDPNTDSDGNSIYEFTFDFKMWRNAVGNKMFRTPISLELLQDMQANGLKPEMILGFLADGVANEINQDLITDLLAIATTSTTDIEIASTSDAYEQCRILYAGLHAKFEDFSSVCNATPTYVVLDKTSFAMILGSGMAKSISVGLNNNIALCNSGLIVFMDITGTLDNQAVFGVKSTMENGFDLASLVFSPFIPNLNNKDIGGDAPESEVDLINFNYLHLTGVSSDQQEMITNLMTKDSASFNSVYGISARYAITAAPFGDDTTSGTIDFSNLADSQRSKLVIKYSITYSDDETATA